MRVQERQYCIRYNGSNSKTISENETSLDYLIKQISPVDIVIVEGFKVSGHRKVEVVNNISQKTTI